MSTSDRKEHTMRREIKHLNLSIEILESRRLLSTSAQFFSPTTGAPVPQTLTLRFDTDVSGSLTAQMVSLKNLSHGQTIHVCEPIFSDGGKTAQFTFETCVDSHGNSYP